MKTLILVPIVLLSACTAIVGHTKSVTYNYVEGEIAELKAEAAVYCDATPRAIKNYFIDEEINKITFWCE